MLKIDKTILEICDNISNNIEKLNDDVGLLSQNILSQLRNLVEAVISKVYIIDYSLGDIDVSYDKTITPGLKYIKSEFKYKELQEFHNSIKISVSHYTLDDNNAERLFLKYLENLIKLRKFLRVEFSLNVLKNLSKFPLNRDTDLYEYYQLISDRIDINNAGVKDTDFDDRYYILKKKPFFINEKIYYEVTAIEATDKYSKFNRFVFYTKIDINPYYSIKIKVLRENILIKGLNIPVIFVTDYQVAIRPCEIDNYAKILGIVTKTNTADKDYVYLTKFLEDTNLSIVNIVNLEEEGFNRIIAAIESAARSKTIINILNQSRSIIYKNLIGANILKYLLLNLRNSTIRNQSIHKRNLVSENGNLSKLRLHNGCIPFEEMPFCSSPLGENPSLFSLFEIIDPYGREHELLARFIKNKTEIDKQIYTDINELDQFENYQELIVKYNENLYDNSKHQLRRIEIYKNKVFLLNYDLDVSFILKKIIELSKSGISNYTNSVNSWLYESEYNIDSKEKESALLNAFANSKVFAIYGAAGTGKTTMLNHFANFFSDKKKVFLSNTYAALENLKRRVRVDNSVFLSVKKYINQSDRTADILFIDECSTVSNEDMKMILSSSNYKLIVLSGDVFQIESITFGDWFDLLRNFISPYSYIELTTPFRTVNDDLISVWDKVRNYDQNVLEYISKGKYSLPIDSGILETSLDNEIILCLNYDGLYGINNVNRLLQQKNKNKPYFIGVQEFKIGDPILFNENSERYSPLLYNNSKGVIHNIIDGMSSLRFQIEIEKSVNELDLICGVSLIGQSIRNNSIIEIEVEKNVSSDSDNSESSTPFNISYAVSIHKSQGLEYDSVKIIIVDEIDELITHNIFYTAITRTKNKLKIYWSPNTQLKILNSFSNNRKRNHDIQIISNKHDLKIIKAY